MLCKISLSCFQCLRTAVTIYLGYTGVTCTSTYNILVHVLAEVMLLLAVLLPYITCYGALLRFKENM
jgi:hypothetical protein